MRPDRGVVLDRQTFLATLTGSLLAARISAEAQKRGAVPSGPSSPWWPVAPFLLIAVGVFLLSTGVLVLVSSRRRRRKLAKILVPLVAGSVCGALWILLVWGVAARTARRTWWRLG